MKLAFILFNYFPHGGLQRDFLRVALMCQNRGHEVHVFTQRWEGEMNPELHYHIIKSSGLQNHTRNKNFITKVKHALLYDNFAAVVGFNKMPHLDLYFAADTCYKMRSQQDRHFFYRLLPRYRTYAELEKSVFMRGRQTEIMLIAHQQLTHFEEAYQTESSRFHLLPPGIEKAHIERENPHAIRTRLRESLALKSDDHMLLMVGSSFRTKGVDRAICALAQLPDGQRARTRLFIIGKGEAKPYVRLAKKLQMAERVHFLGARDDIADFLYAADVLVHPAYHENTGTVLLEALVAGLPVLTLDNCGYAFYVEKANAGIVLKNPYSETAFMSALGGMLRCDKTVWQRNARQFAESADLYSMPERAVHIIEEVARRKSVSTS